MCACKMQEFKSGRVHFNVNDWRICSSVRVITPLPTRIRSQKRLRKYRILYSIIKIWHTISFRITYEIRGDSTHFKSDIVPTFNFERLIYFTTPTSVYFQKNAKTITVKPHKWNTFLQILTFIFWNIISTHYMVNVKVQFYYSYKLISIFVTYREPIQ